MEYFGIVSKIMKIFIISILTLHTSTQIINETSNTEKNVSRKIIELIAIIIMTLGHFIINDKVGVFYSTIYLILCLTLIFCEMKTINIGYSLIINMISLSINYVIYSIAILIIGIGNKFIESNDVINFFLITFIYLILIKIFLSKKRFKKGFDFLRKNVKDGYLDAIILNISVIIIFMITIIPYYESMFARKMLVAIALISVTMFIAISKSFQMYYKHRLLIKELDEAKAELEKIHQENENLTKENIEISKASHTLSHKQKILEHKLNKILMKAEIAEEISPEEEKQIKENFENISKEINKEKISITLDKTGIDNIDDALEYMQSECIKNNIEFNLKITGNIYHMTNKYITKDELETLISDHIKDAIIAINHCDTENKSILVRLGKIENVYSLYIYDSGIEFEEETLKNLGKKPSTTHADEGGTGMGFMNTFDVLKEHKGSLIIEEIGMPSKNNYTKVIKIKFDEKEEFKVISYKNNEEKCTI